MPRAAAAAAASLALALALALCAAPVAAQASRTNRTVLQFGSQSAPTGAGAIKYRTVLLAAVPADWFAADFDDSSWPAGQQHFGNSVFCSELTSRFGTPVTNFPINHELLVRFHFNIPASADLATYDDLLTVIVDNGLRGAYVNGHSISFSIERGGCDGVSTEFRVDLPNSRFVHGDNVIALHGYDLGGQSFFNMQYRDSFVPISEPPVQPDCTVVSYPSQQPASAVASTEGHCVSLVCP